MTSPVDQIKERLGIVDVVSSYLKLDKAGMNLKARCPFHNEKSASFFVSPARGSFHCFGCNRGGDIFTFVEDIEGVTFTDALKTLALRAGIKLERFENGGTENKKIYELLELSTKFFEYNLEKNEAVKIYLMKRGLLPETIKNFRLGYALGGWENLVKFLKSRGFTEKLIESSGLAIQGKQGYYDRFRGRIMFPIADSQGRIVAYSGRIFENLLSPKVTFGESTAAKYVNSPETELYNKSKILYGYDKAKRAMLKDNSAIIVEGQMDLVMAHQAGSTNAVAVSGTALTEEHVGFIKRFTDKLLLAFDADPAGLKAVERGVKLALSLGMDVRIIRMPPGLDPADFILKDKEAWQKNLIDAKHIIDFYLDYLSAKKLPTREFCLEVSHKVLPYIYWIPNAIDQAHFIKEIANRLDIDENVIRAELKKEIVKEKKENISVDSTKNEAKNSKLAVMEKLLGIYLWQGEKEGRDLVKFKEKFEEIIGSKLSDLLEKLTPDKKSSLVFQAEMYYNGHEDLSREIEELLDNLEIITLEERLAEFLQELRRAEREKNEAKAEEIMKKCHATSQKINEIKNRRFIEK